MSGDLKLKLTQKQPPEGFDSHPQSFLLKMNELLGRSFPRTSGLAHFAKERVEAPRSSICPAMSSMIVAARHRWEYVVKLAMGHRPNCACRKKIIHRLGMNI
jgi:hypothetical protein